MMTPEEIKEVKKGIALTAVYYARNLSGDVIGMMADDLRDLPYAAVSEAFKAYRNNSKNKSFPLPAQIRDMVSPTETPESIARDTAARIQQAVVNLGYSNGNEAKLFIGPAGWRIVERFGGWSYLCQNLGLTISATTFHAQARELALDVGRTQQSYPQLDHQEKPRLTNKTSDLQKMGDVFSLIKNTEE
jgi:hypothetical protein